MRILFVCTGNTCRSPMAERLGRLLCPEHDWESAGVMPTGVMHHMTARVLDEHGAESGGFDGRDVADLDLSGFDHLVLIGRTAQALTPDPPSGVEVHFWDVADPYEVVGSETEILEAYQACAEDLKARIAALSVR